uniref:G_PROTEIN_RECEP_F3_4 domain-containing protein n=1 Tax=Caenorhabditis tropicalis TaxID=1561998 RepID=A0A1I7USK8_9PELO
MILLSTFFIILTYFTNIIFIDFVPITKDSRVVCPNINGKVSNIFLGMLTVFGIVFVLRRYFLMKSIRQKQEVYKAQLKAGVCGLIGCSVVLKIAFWYLSKDFYVGLIFTAAIQLFSMIIVLTLIMPGACSCEMMYRQWKEYLGFVCVLTVVVSYASMSFMASQIDLIVQLIYTISIAVFIIDMHVLSYNQLRVLTKERDETEMKKRQTAQENHLFLGDSFMV